MKNVSVIIPVYQNRDSLSKLEIKLQELVMSAKDRISFHFIFVDDGSTDGSYGALVEMKSRNLLPSVQIIKLTRNFGQLPAIYAGIKANTNDYLSIISADLQDDPKLIIALADKVSPESPLAIAERSDREDGFLSRLTSRVFYSYLRRFIIKNYPKNGFDYCLFSKDVASELLQYEQKNTHLFVALMWLGYPYATIQYKRDKREHGKSQWTLFKRLKLFLDVAVGFSYLPIRTVTSFGILMAFCSSLMAVLFVIQRIFQPSKAVPGWTSIVILLTFFNGIIVLILGLLGEYLWRTLDSAKKRQIYVIDKNGSL